MLKELLQLREEMNEEMVKIRLSIKEETLKLQKMIDQNEQSIQDVIEEPLTQARKLSGKDTGTVNIVVDGVKVKQVVPKSVSWDQEKMFDIWSRIQEAGDEPENYMTVKTTHSVNEKNYRSFPDPVKAIFAEARTLKTGAPKVTFE